MLVVFGLGQPCSLVSLLGLGPVLAPALFTFPDSPLSRLLTSVFPVPWEPAWDLLHPIH